MKNEIFEKDYRITEKNKDTSSNKSNMIDYAIENELFKAYNDAMKKIPKYIVQEDKEAYEDLLSRLDAYAKELHGKITGTVDYDDYDSYIIVELPYFEANTREEFALLSDIASKAHSVTFEPSKDGGIRLYIMINYFNEIGDTKNILTECIMNDEKLVKMLAEERDKEKAQLLSDPKLSEYLAKCGKDMGMTADEFYDWLEEFYNSNPEKVIQFLLDHLPDINPDEDEPE